MIKKKKRGEEGKKRTVFGIRVVFARRMVRRCEELAASGESPLWHLQTPSQGTHRGVRVENRPYCVLPVCCDLQARKIWCTQR